MGENRSESGSTARHDINGKAKEVAGQMVGDPDLETAGRDEQRTGVDPTAEVRENAAAASAGTVKEIVGRVVGDRARAWAGRRQRRRHGSRHRHPGR